MSRKKKNIGTSWAGKFAKEASNQRFLDEMRQQTEDTLAESLRSAYRSAKLENEIRQTRAEIRAMKEDPDGYLYEKEQERLKNSPKTIGNYLKNWWADLGRKMNDFQIGEFQGYMDRATQWKRLSDDLQEYWDIEDRVNQINDEISKLLMKTTSDPSEMLDINLQITDLESEQSALMLRHEYLQNSVDAFKSYIPGSLKSRYYDLMAGNGEKFGFSNNGIFGRTGQMHDEMGDILRHTSTMFNPQRSRQEQRDMLKRAIDEYDNKMLEWQRGIQYNIDDRERYAKVDRWYAERAAGAGTDIFDKNTWLYGMSGLVAGSTSGLSKIVPAMLIGLATGGGVAATGGAASWMIGALGGAAAYQANYGAGVGENNSEVAMAYTEQLQDYLLKEKGLNGSLYDDIISEGRRKLDMGSSFSDEEVFEKYRQGRFTINNAKANKEMAKLAIGLENQFQDDMAATTWTAGLETVLDIVPFGAAANVRRAARYLILRRAAGRKAMRNFEESAFGKTVEKAAQRFSKGYEVGQVASPLGGVAAGTANALVVAPAAKYLKSKFVKEILGDVSNTAEIALNVSEDLLRKKFGRSTRKKYIKNLSGRIVTAAISESIEEGKQAIAADRYRSGEYNSAKIKSVSETILDDFLAGSKSAALLLGMPFEGLMSEKDRKILLEMKGGLILGGLLTGIVNTIRSIAPYRAELKATTAILNTVLLDKATKQDNLNKAKIYAEAAKSQSSFLNMLNAFDRLRLTNKDQFDSTGEYGIHPDHINNEEKRFMNVAKMANDLYTVKQAKTQGIKTESQEYNNFVAAKTIATDELEDYAEISKTAENNLNEVLTRIAGEILTERLRYVSEAIPGENETENKESSSPVAAFTSAENFEQLQNVALYTALLRRKQQLEVGILNAERGGHGRIKLILNNQLTLTNDRINNLKSVIQKYTNEDESIDINNLESVEKSLVLDKNNHDELSEAYRQDFVADQDLDLAIEQYQRVVGKPYLNGKEVKYGEKVDWGKEYDNVTFKDGNAKSVFKEILETLDDDDDLASVIDEDFENRTDNEGNEIISSEEAKDIEEAAPENNPVQEFHDDIAKGSETAKPTPQASTSPVKPISKPYEPVSPTLPTITPEVPQTPSEEDSYKNIIMAARNGDENAIKQLEKYGIDWEKKPVVRFVAKGEVDNILNGGTYNGRFNNGRVDVTNNTSPTTAASGDYRITFKDDLDWALNDRLLIKNKDLGDGWLTGGYSLNDVATIEKRNEDGSYSVIYNSNKVLLTTTPEQQKTIDALKKRAEASKEYVKEVTSEYYLIEVNGQRIKMPRVHAVMPKYWASDGSFMPALQLGNIFDNLARIFFGDKTNITRYEQDKQSLVDQLFNKKASHKDNVNDPGKDLTYKDLFKSKEEFEKTIDDLYNLAKEYLKLGWELSTEPIVWYSNFAKGWIAGETDMLAVDRNGDIHIIDFKTAMWKPGVVADPFAKYEVDYRFKLPQQLDDQLLELDESDFTAGPRKTGLSKKARTFIKSVRKALKSDKIKVIWDAQSGQAKLTYIESKYSSIGSMFRQSHTFEGKVKGSKEDEYSDQLTAYREMIQAQLANVVDMEVLGFRADYTHNEENLTGVNSIRNEKHGKPFRIKVSLSDEMQNILNNEGVPVELEPEEKSPVEDAAEKNEAIETTQKQEQQQSTSSLPKNPQPEVVQPGTAQTKRSTPVNPTFNGYSNLNELVIDRDHPELANGAVFDPNFISEAITNGTVELYTEKIDDKYKEPALYADITYRGKTYKRIYIYADPRLLTKILDLEKNKQPGQKIVATSISRTSGKIKVGNVVAVSKAGLIDQKVEDLKFNSSSRSFGFVKGGKVVTFVGNNTKQQDVIYQFTSNPPAEGTLVYLKQLPRSESEGPAIVPVAIGKKSLQGDADFIIDCLKKIDVINTPYVTTIGGKLVSIGATRRELLDVLIPYVDDISQVGRMYSIVRHPNQPSIFYIVNNSRQPIAQVDLRNEESINSFKEVLGRIYIEEQHDILASQIGSSLAYPAFRKIKQFFARNKEGVKSLSISDSLKFDFEDFKGDGLSGLGWYVKSGIFTTNYAGMSSPKISINDVGYTAQKIEPNNPTQTTILEEETPQSTGFSLEDLDFANWGETQRRKTAEDEGKPVLTKKNIIKHLRPILGDLVDDPAVVQVIETLANDPRIENAKVVGKASADAITIYNEAFEGVEYHEAFHRIFELFVPKATREAIYQKVANRLGINLNESTKENKYFGHRQVAEWLADKYMNSRAYNVSTGINWLDRVINWIVDAIRALCSINNRQLYKVFLDINQGKYKNQKAASKENVDRFNELFGLLNYEIHGTQFDHIANDPMYEEVKNTTFYCLINGQNIDVSGATVQNAQISRAAFMRGADRLKKLGFDIFGTEVDPSEKTAAQLAMSEVYSKFESVADDLADMMANISTDYRKIMQDEGREDADGGESLSSYDENFFKWSYEFNRFDKTTSRVKFFFSTIPDLEYSDDTKKSYKLATNGLGMPQLLPMNYVFNEVLSNLWDVDTVEEVVQRLSNLAMQDPMYAVILSNLNKVIKGVTNKDGSTNADNEALLAQLMTTIRSNRHTFMLLKAVSDPKGVYDIILQRTDADYNARVLHSQWSQVLAKGGSETLKVDKYGRIIFNPKNKEAAETFKKIADLFNEIQDAVSAVNNGKKEISIPQYVYPEYEYEDSLGNKIVTSAYLPDEKLNDITDPKLCDKLKSAIVEALNRIGINIHKREFEYMLQHKYGSTDWEAIKAMVQSTDETDSIGSFMFFLNNIVKNGKLNLKEDGKFVGSNGRSVPFDNVFSSMAFIKELANWKYEYRHAHDLLSVLATGGNRFYEMSDNDYMSDVLRVLNKRGKWFDELRQDPYNYFEGGLDNLGESLTYGSITLKQLSEDPDLKIALKHFVGFKTDKRGDEGLDYFEISRREDYLSKAGILENDGMISLTLSDKKKYVYISGIKLPGIDYASIHKNKDGVVDVEQLASQLIFVPDKVASSVYNILQRQDVVDQMISYAVAEHESIIRNAERLNDGHRKVANFDTNELSVKFSSLLGVWEETFDKDGNPSGEQYVSFNDNKRSWLENLALAEAYFFDRTREEQEALMGRILTKRTEEELKTAQKLGLVEKVGNHPNHFLNYKNVGLSNRAIESIKRSYKVAFATDPNFTDQMAESMAVVMYLNDISAKAIMSGQEMERLFSGNPAFYKWKYNKNGKLIDRTVDELKRLGGLGSTGTNNFTQLSNIPEKYKENGVFTGKYKCAEVDNEMVSSPQYEEVTRTIYKGTLRSDIIRKQIAAEIVPENERHLQAIVTIRKNKDISETEKDRFIQEENKEHLARLQEIREDVCSNIDSSSVEDLEKRFPEAAESAKYNSKEVSDAFSGGIDVADGGAYISDEMCEMLLRMEGAYSKDIEEAFKILREEVKADYLGKIEAYQKILTSVIGSLKYTAFGRRTLNGNSVPYYHKMALFPIFKCIATGRMSNVFDKMKEQGIDMLLVNSAVKVGSEGSKPIDWSTYREDDDPNNQNNFSEQGADGWSWKHTFQESFSFDTYDCEFDYLRKQLNTDPKEEEMLRMGTLAQKIIFSNLEVGRTYTAQSGEQVTGKQLLDRIMHSSNALSNIGVDKINQKFFVTNENGELIDKQGNVISDRNSDKRQLDIEKFAKEVSKLMSDRGADKNVMKALELVTTSVEGTGQETKRLHIPLGAISNAGWLESVLISMLNKEIIDVNTPGAFFIQRSIWAMEGARMYDRQKGSIKGYLLYNGKRLQMVNEEGSMDCVLSIDFFRNILPLVWSGEYEVDEDGEYIYGNKTDEYGNPVPKKKMRDMTFNEAKEWLIKKGIIGDKAKASIVAYRIPTQAESSIHALRCVDVIPAVRDTVILPQEFTKITGSDKYQCSNFKKFL